MVNIVEVLTTWTPVSGIATNSVMYFGPGSDLTTARLNINGMWNSIADRLSNSTSWTVQTVARVLDDATGNLLGLVSDTTPLTGVGASVGDPVPDAAQGLLRWGTGVVSDGRFIQGRTFIPGISESATTAGNLSADTVADFNSAAQTFVDATSRFGIWRRPRAATTELPARAGLWVEAISGSGASELAVLRRRRNRV